MEHADDHSLSKESKTAPNVEIGELLDVHISEIDITELNSHDEVLSKKMYLVNNALDEIGFTGYHWKMFFLNGMGYAVDLLIGQSKASFYLKSKINSKYISLDQLSPSMLGSCLGHCFGDSLLI